MRRIAVAQGVAWRMLHNFFRNKSLLIPSIAFPLFFFTAFAGGLAGIQNVPGFDFPSGYTAFQFVFVLLQSAAFGGVFTGFGIARDFESGFARRLLLASPNRSGIVLGYAIAALVRWLVTASLLTVIALAVRMKVGGDGLDLLGLYTLGLLVNVAATLWAAGVAMRLRTMQAGPAMQMPVFLVLFFAPVYVPLALLDGWIHTVAVVNPLTLVIESGRGFISGTPTEVFSAFLAAAALGALFCVWAIRGLRKAEAPVDRRVAVTEPVAVTSPLVELPPNGSEPRDRLDGDSTGSPVPGRELARLGRVDGLVAMLEASAQGGGVKRTACAGGCAGLRKQGAAQTRQIAQPDREIVIGSRSLAQDPIEIRGSGEDRQLLLPEARLALPDVDPRAEFVDQLVIRNIRRRNLARHLKDRAEPGSSEIGRQPLHVGAGRRPTHRLVQRRTSVAAADRDRHAQEGADFLERCSDDLEVRNDLGGWRVVDSLAGCGLAQNHLFQREMLAQLACQGWPPPDE